MVLGYDDDGLNPPKILIQDINELDLPKIMKVLGKHNREAELWKLRNLLLFFILS